MGGYSSPGCLLDDPETAADIVLVVDAGPDDSIADLAAIIPYMNMCATNFVDVSGNLFADVTPFWREILSSLLVDPRA